MRLKPTRIDELIATVKSTTDDPAEPWQKYPCMEWKGGSRNGYGRVRRSLSRKSEHVHRIAFEVRFGPIPEGLCVMHKCDNRACFRWSHLAACTQIENIRDMDDKGRRFICSGVLNGRAKLTQEKADEIRAIRAATGLSVKKLARQFGVNSGTISLLIRGFIWRKY